METDDADEWDISDEDPDSSRRGLLTWEQVHAHLKWLVARYLFGARHCRESR